MIRNLLATTAIATLIATGAYAQATTPTPPAAGEEPGTPVEEGSSVESQGSVAAPADSTEPADSTAQDSTTAPADDTAQDSATPPADDTAQDSTTTMEPADDTAQDSTTMEPAEDTAQDATTTPSSDEQMAKSENPDVEGQLASNLIGAAVFNGANDDAENIGEVKDVVIGKDGMAKFVVIGVGGFLGIGEKDVAIEYATLEWAERDGDMWLIVETTQEQLESQEAFDRTAYDPEAMAAQEDQTAADATAPAGGATMSQTDAAATAPATTGEAMETETAETTEPVEGADEDMAAADSAETAEDKQTTETAEAPAAGSTTTTETAQAPAANAETDAAAETDATQTAAIDRSTLQESDMSAIRAEDFVGTTVYGANEETIGEIGDVILSEDGKVDAVLIDVGGFLGMGEKEVAVGMDNLQFMQDGDGNRYLYTEWTQEQLEAQPAYDEAGYAENRDTMRMTVE